MPTPAWLATSTPGGDNPGIPTERPPLQPSQAHLGHDCPPGIVHRKEGITLGATHHFDSLIGHLLKI